MVHAMVREERHEVSPFLEPDESFSRFDPRCFMQGFDIRQGSNFGVVMRRHHLGSYFISFNESYFCFTHVYLLTLHTSAHGSSKMQWRCLAALIWLLATAPTIGAEETHAVGY
jgi:hypothetical protein